MCRCVKEKLVDAMEEWKKYALLVEQCHSYLSDRAATVLDCTIAGHELSNRASLEQRNASAKVSLETLFTKYAIMQDFVSSSLVFIAAVLVNMKGLRF